MFVRVIEKNIEIDVVINLLEDLEERFRLWNFEGQRANRGVDCQLLCILLIHKERYAAMTWSSFWTESIIQSIRQTDGTLVCP